MPVVTINPEEYERFELKTAPPDGYIMLRPLPYGMKLTRRDKATRMKMMAEMPKGGRGAAENQTIELETFSEWTQNFDFAYCVGDHNLMNADGSLIDFSKPMGWKMIDPRVGSEIERYLNTLNEDPDEESVEDFLKRPASSSEGNQNESSTDSPEQLSPVM